MRICKNCVLPESFPGVKLNKKDVCNFCIEFEKEENLESKKRTYRKKFERLLKEQRGRAAYDGLVSYSGGKDSTYTLAVLTEEFGLNLLAFTLDNSFLPEQTYKNIRKVTENLSIDHIFLKPGFSTLQKIFRAAAEKNIFSKASLTRASTICTACMSIVRFSALRCALEKNIPFLIFGWSPGQIPISASIMKNNPAMLGSMQKAVLGPLSEFAGLEIKRYFLEEGHLRKDRFFPYNISPLAFLEYDEEKIMKRAAGLGWEKPPDLDSNSSNCLLNSLANIIHKDLYGYNPYVFELAKLVREGYLERFQALEKLERPESEKTVALVKKRLFS